MICEKCGKEMPDGDNKICDDCKKEIIQTLVSDNSEKNDIIQKNDTTKKNEIKKQFPIKKVILFFLVLILIILGIMFITKKGLFSYRNKEGNTIANIRNYGYTAQNGSWIYYIAPSEDGSKTSIYKSKEDGSKKTCLLEEEWDIVGLNVKDDYLYFVAISSEEVENNSEYKEVDDSNNEELDEIDNKVYRMKTDGSGLEVINNNGLHNNCYEIYVVDNKVYYIGVDQNIYCMNLDGKNVQRINDDQTGFLGITNDYIFLNTKKELGDNTKTEDSETEENNEKNDIIEFETCVMNRDGTNKRSITGERLYNINVLGDYVYYVNSMKQFCKVKLDGTDDSVIFDKGEVYNLNISNKYAYYLSYADNNYENVALYRINLDGSDNKIIYRFNTYSSYLNVVNNNAVFMDNDNQIANVKLVNSEGNVCIKLYELSYDDYIKAIDKENDESKTNETRTENAEQSNSAENNVDTNSTQTESK